MKFEKMKEIRETKELKQWQIANELKVDRSTYAGWETGKDTIPLRKLYELSNYYKISIDSIDLNRVAKNLKKLRIDNNLKQRDIFNMLNIASSSYSVYETGQTLIQTSFIYQIAKKYNSSIDEIIKSND